jgi:hypothetical protein
MDDLLVVPELWLFEKTFAENARVFFCRVMRKSQKFS